MPFLPRARFVQSLLFGSLAILIGLAGSALAIFSAIKAREHTTPPVSTSPTSSPVGVIPSQQVVPYNAAASTVAAVWLFFWVRLVSSAIRRCLIVS